MGTVTLAIIVNSIVITAITGSFVVQQIGFRRDWKHARAQAAAMLNQFDREPDGRIYYSTGA